MSEYVLTRAVFAMACVDQVNELTNQKKNVRHMLLNTNMSEVPSHITLLYHLVQLYSNSLSYTAQSDARKQQFKVQLYMGSIIPTDFWRGGSCISFTQCFTGSFQVRSHCMQQLIKEALTPKFCYLDSLQDRFL